MGILDEFIPKRDGWSFVNWGEGTDFSWDLYRRTYLAINPTNDPVESPLDVAFFQIFKSCAANGNCGGMAMLALALFKYGGTWGSARRRPSTRPPTHRPQAAGESGPARSDQHHAGAPVQRGRHPQLPRRRQGGAAQRRRRGMEPHPERPRQRRLLHAFPVQRPVRRRRPHDHPLPRRDGWQRDVLHVWNSNRPSLVPRALRRRPQQDRHHRSDVLALRPERAPQRRRCTTDRTTAGSSPSRRRSRFTRAGSHQRWLRPYRSHDAVRQRHGCGRHPDRGRRRPPPLHERPRAPGRSDLETSPARRLPGVAPWPWPGGLPGLARRAVLPRAAARKLAAERLGRGGDTTSCTCRRGTSPSSLRARRGEREGPVRLEARRTTTSRSCQNQAPRRRFDIHHLRRDASGGWRSVRVKNALVTGDQLRVYAPVEFDAVEISGTTTGAMSTSSFAATTAARSPGATWRSMRWAGPACGAVRLGATVAFEG